MARNADNDSCVCGRCVTVARLGEISQNWATFRSCLLPKICSRRQGTFRGRTGGDAVPIVEKLPEVTPGNSVKSLRMHYGRRCEAFSDQKCTKLPYFAYTISILSECDTPEYRRSAPGTWTQTPISARLASVPVVPVLRNYTTGGRLYT